VRLKPGREALLTIKETGDPLLVAAQEGREVLRDLDFEHVAIALDGRANGVFSEHFFTYRDCASGWGALYLIIFENTAIYLKKT
jgi:hypothetical protein